MPFDPTGDNMILKELAQQIAKEPDFEKRLASIKFLTDPEERAFVGSWVSKIRSHYAGGGGPLPDVKADRMKKGRKGKKAVVESTGTFIDNVHPDELAAYKKTLAADAAAEAIGHAAQGKELYAGLASPLDVEKRGVLNSIKRFGKKLPIKGALKYGGAALTAAWLGSELYDLLVEEPKLERAANAEHAMALTGDTGYLQGTHDKSFAALVSAGDDIARGGARAQLEQQMRQEDELRGAMAPWRAEMAAQAMVSKPSLPELLAKMGIDPYQGR